MYCPSCGKQISDTAKFCEYCGANVRSYRSTNVPDYILQEENDYPQVYNDSPEVVYVEKKRGVKKYVLAIILILLLSSIVNNAFDDNKESSKSNGSSRTYTENRAGTTTPEPSYEITDMHFEYFVNSIGNTDYYAWVEITNTGNTNLYMGSCTFDFEDEDEHLLQTETWISSCPDIIAPGEKGYYYNGLGSSQIDAGVSLDNGIYLVPHFSVETARGNPVDYTVSDTALREGTYGPTITGRVTNDSGEDDSLFYIQAIYYDANGNVLGITGTNILDFPTGSTASFEISSLGLPPNATTGVIADYQVIARAAYHQY